MPIITEDPLKVRDGYNPTKISFNSVKGEVEDAMKFDWKRDKVDDAKKKAIYTSHSYDDFKQRVAGCTLKPIHKGEFNAPPKFAFNRQVDGTKKPSGYVPAGAALPVDPCAGKSLQAVVPATGLRNAREFEREFRRRKTAEERVAFLEQLDVDSCKRLFAKDFDAELLRHSIEALEEVGRSTGSSAAARGFLTTTAIACPGPVAVSASFLTSGDRMLIAQMLAREEAEDASEDVRICNTFGVPPMMVHNAVAALAPVAGPELPPAAAASPVDVAETPKRPEAEAPEAAAAALQHHYIGTPEAAEELPTPSRDAERRELFHEEEAPAGGLIDGMD